MTIEIGPIIERHLPEIISLRHELHQHPEIRFDERWTSDRLARFLEETGIPHRRGYAGGTGIVAWLGSGQGKTVALRTDIDALEIAEQSAVPYASQIPGRMHACGHDGHMACLCGTIRVLNEVIGRLNGTVRFLFQPAEELGGGAAGMVEDGALDGVDAIFALHGDPALPLGTIATRPGWLMASADMFKITVKGQGCHGAEPAAGVDPVVVAAHITTALQTVVAREIDPAECAVVTVGSIEAGGSSNIIPETAMMRGTVRAFTPGVMEHVQRSVRRIAEKTAEALRASATVEFGARAYPALCNDEQATEFLCASAGKAIGPENVLTVPKPVMVSEDFSYYAQRTAAAFFFLGLKPGPDRPHPALHTPYFDFEDEALRVGIRVMASAAIDFLSLPQ